jgi:hypothetical protein
MSIPSDIATYLAAQGYGVYANVNPALNTIFQDEFQDQPSNQIVLFFGGSRAPAEVMGGDAVDYPAIDIQVRNTSKATARSTAEALRVLLDCQEINGASLFDDLSAPVFLGKDESNRYRFVITFSITKERI